MKLQQGKWYVCIKSWSDDGWTKFHEGDLKLCEYDDLMIDCYGIKHLFIDDEPEEIFREATKTERNIASATEIDIEEFMKEIGVFEPTDTLEDIYRKGAEKMLRDIKERLSIKG